MAHGSGQINYFDMLWGIYFNKQMVEDLSLESPYDLVNSGKWTMDAMKKLGIAVSNDMNGDGEMTEDDRFGLITINGGSSLAFLHGCDERGIDIENGKLALSKIDDRMFGVMTIIKQNVYENKDEVLIKDDKTLFTSGHSLFYAEVLGNAKVLRSMDTDFGIIPFPKYDEAQENYVSYIFIRCYSSVTPDVIIRREALEKRHGHGELQRAFIRDRSPGVLYDNPVRQDAPRRGIG